MHGVIFTVICNFVETFDKKYRNIRQSSSNAVERGDGCYFQQIFTVDPIGTCFNVPFASIVSTACDSLADMPL